MAWLWYPVQIEEEKGGIPFEYHPFFVYLNVEIKVSLWFKLKKRKNKQQVPPQKSSPGSFVLSLLSLLVPMPVHGNLPCCPSA